MPEVFHMVAPPGRATAFQVAILLIPLLLTIGFTWLIVGSRQAEFRLSPDGLQIQKHLYGRRIPAGELVVSEARVVDLEEEPPLRPSLRTNGIGLPGYQAGWFRLKNRQKALLFLTDRSRVVYLPTTKGYVLLMSMDRPDEFVRKLKAPDGG